MADNWKTIRVPEDDYQEAKEQKEENDRTWGQQLVCNNPTSNDSVDSDAIMRKLEQIEGAQVDTVSEAMELAEDATYDHEEILGRIDDLENTLPRKIGDELR